MGRSTLIDLLPVIQRNDHDCGPAVARSILRHFQRPVTRVDQVLQPHPKHGTSIERLASLFLRARLGVILRQEIPLDWLRVACAEFGPVVCAITPPGTGGHWVAVRGVQGGRVHLMDPEAGLCDLPAADFASIWHDKTADGAVLLRFGMPVWSY